MDWCGASSDAGAVAVARGENSNAVDLLVELCSHPHLWLRALGSDQKNEE